MKCSDWDSNPGPTDSNFNTLTTRPRCLPVLYVFYMTVYLFCILFLIAREETHEVPNWGREVSVIDLLKGSDGHVYKGRFRQVC